MHLPNLPSIGLTSILFNTLYSHAHGKHQQLLRGGELPIPEVPSPEKLIGTNWQLKDIRGVPAIHDSQELYFETETELSGYDGCNTGSMEYGILRHRTATTPKQVIAQGLRLIFR